jgi:hypothetical protein
MATKRPTHFRDPAALRADLERLIRERGPARFGIFHASGEGRLLPGGSENGSGYVVDERGRHYFYWLDWDVERAQLTLTRWQELQPSDFTDLQDDPEYREARAAAGLPTAELSS